MVDCVACGSPLGGEHESPGIRGPAGAYHLSCAPDHLLRDADEEYAAIVRKGVRYFLEKFGTSSDGATDPGEAFLSLGSAIRRERSRRPGA
jgi:hypothetical protein